MHPPQRCRQTVPGLAESAAIERAGDTGVARAVTDRQPVEESLETREFNLADRRAGARRGRRAMETRADDRGRRHGGDERAVVAFRDEAP